MLQWRLLLGSLFAAALAALCWLDFHAPLPGLALIPLAGVVSLAASNEIIALFSARDLQPIRAVVYGGNLLIVLSGALAWLPVHQPWFTTASAGFPPLGLPLIALSLAILWAFTAEMAAYEKPGGAMVHVALSVFSLVYVGLLMAMLVQLRLFGDSKTGMVALLSLIVVVKFGDIGAYTLGRLFGRHKLAPTVSPGKTVEGAIGAILFSLLGAYIVFIHIEPALTGRIRPAPAWGWIVYAAVVSVAGMVGDLAESLFKRDMGRKDSSTWLAGFGGVLDLIDSLLLAAPVAYIGWAIGLV